MYLLDDATAVAQPPANPVLPGTPGYATDGDLVAGQARTNLRAWHYNLMMRELQYVVTQATIAPSATDSTQVYQAIAKLIAAAVAGLQADIGFTPVQQGGGPGQLTNKIEEGWDGTQLLLAVDGAAIGAFALKADLTAAITALVGGAPGALETLKELADAINDDASYAATVTNLLALKAPLAAPALTTGVGGIFPTTPSPPAGDDSQSLVPSSWVKTDVAAALAGVAHKTNISNAAGPYYDWDPVTGRVEVWGQYTTAVTIEGPIEVNFPVNIGRFDGGFAGANETTNTGDTTFPLDSWTAESMTFLAQDSQGGNAATAAGFFWRAWGYSAAEPS